MTSTSEILVISDPHKIKPHPFLVGDAGYHQCAACPVAPAHNVHCISRDDQEWVCVYDAALPAPRMEVERQLVVACVTGDQFAAAVRARAARLRMAA